MSSKGQSWGQRDLYLPQDRSQVPRDGRVPMSVASTVEMNKFSHMSMDSRIPIASSKTQAPTSQTGCLSSYGDRVGVHTPVSITDT